MKGVVPAVSVIMPLYNKEKEVSRAICSVLSQTYRNFELIIVNDGSTDKSLDIVESFQDPRIRVINQQNQGVASARNRGISEAVAEVVAFLDADDEWQPEFLSVIIDLKRRFSEAKVYGTGYWIESVDGFRRKNIIKGLPKGFDKGLIDNYFQVAVISDPPLWSSAVAVDKRAIEEVGGFPEGIVAGEDLLTWARLAARYRIGYYASPQATYYKPSINERPCRCPLVPDSVGDALRDLLKSIKNTDNVNNLKHYIGLWHTMRVVLWLKMDHRFQAIPEIFKALYFAKNKYKLFILMAIAFLPFKTSWVINFRRKRI